MLNAVNTSKRHCVVEVVLFHLNHLMLARFYTYHPNIVAHGEAYELGVIGKRVRAQTDGLLEIGGLHLLKRVIDIVDSQNRIGNNRDASAVFTEFYLFILILSHHHARK